MVKYLKSTEEAEIKKALLDHIKECYAGMAYRSSEPKLTVAYLVGYIEQHSCHHHIDWMRHAHKFSIVRNILEKARRRGELSSSLCIGESGREARAYEPVT